MPGDFRLEQAHRDHETLARKYMPSLERNVQGDIDALMNTVYIQRRLGRAFDHSSFDINLTNYELIIEPSAHSSEKGKEKAVSFTIGLEALKEEDRETYGHAMDILMKTDAAFDRLRPRLGGSYTRAHEEPHSFYDSHHERFSPSQRSPFNPDHSHFFDPSASETELEGLRSRVRSLEERLEALEGRRERSITGDGPQGTQRQDNTAELKRKIEDLEHDLRSLEEKKDSLQDHFNALDSESGTLREQISQLEEKNRTNQSQLREREEELSGSSAKHKEEISELQAQVGEKEEALRAISEQMHSVTEEKEGLVRDLEKQSKALTAARELHALSSEENALLRGDLHTAQGRLDEKSQELVEAKTSAHHQLAREKTLHEQQAVQQHELDRQKQRIERLEGVNLKQKERLRALDGEKTELEEGLSRVQREAQNSKHALVRAQGDLELVSKEKETLQNSVQRLSQEAERLNGQIAKLEEKDRQNQGIIANQTRGIEALESAHEDAIGALKLELIETKIALEQEKEKLTEASLEMAVVQEEKERAQTLSRKAKEEQRALEGKLSEKEGEIKRLGEALSTAKKESETLSGVVSEMEKEIESTREKAAQEAQERAKKFDAITSGYAAQSEGLQSRIETLEKEKKALSARMASLEENTSGTEALQSELDNAQRELEALKQEHQDLESSLDRLIEDQTAALSLEKQEVEEKLAALEAKHRAQTKALGEREEENSALRRQNALLQEEIAKLKGLNAAQKQQLEKGEKDRALKDQTIEALTIKRTQLKKENSGLRETHAHLLTENRRVEEAMGGLQRELSLVEKELSAKGDVEKEVANLKEKVAGLTKALEQAQRELQKALTEKVALEELVKENKEIYLTSYDESLKERDKLDRKLDAAEEGKQILIQREKQCAELKENVAVLKASLAKTVDALAKAGISLDSEKSDETGEVFTTTSTLEAQARFDKPKGPGRGPSRLTNRTPRVEKNPPMPEPIVPSTNPSSESVPPAQDIQPPAAVLPSPIAEENPSIEPPKAEKTGFNEASRARIENHFAQPRPKAGWSEGAKTKEEILERLEEQPNGQIEPIKALLEGKVSKPHKETISAPLPQPTKREEAPIPSSSTSEDRKFVHSATLPPRLTKHFQRYEDGTTPKAGWATDLSLDKALKKLEDFPNAQREPLVALAQGKVSKPKEELLVEKTTPPAPQPKPIEETVEAKPQVFLNERHRQLAENSARRAKSNQKTKI